MLQTALKIQTPAQILKALTEAGYRFRLQLTPVSGMDAALHSELAGTFYAYLICEDKPLARALYQMLLAVPAVQRLSALSHNTSDEDLVLVLDSATMGVLSGLSFVMDLPRTSTDVCGTPSTVFEGMVTRQNLEGMVTSLSWLLF